LELLAAIDELDYTSDVLAAADHVPVNTLTAPVFDREGRVAFAVALHLAEPELAVTRVEELTAALRSATERMTHTIGGHLPDRTPTTAAAPARTAALIGESP
jgi:DNA-binding IclR family transcriptional regulator